MSETPRDEQRDPEEAARSRGEDESAEVEGHMKTRNPEEAARSRDEDEKESPDEGRLASRQPQEGS